MNGTCLIIFVLFSVALKFGVGVALVFVAHFVLIRKWSDDGLYEFFININIKACNVIFYQLSES